MNLLSNAIKFTPYGGIIKITAKKVYTTDDLSVQDEVLYLAVKANPNKTFLEMQVRETGIGIKEDDLPKLF